MQRLGRLICGLLICGCGFGGLVSSVRASRAQWIYHQSKFACGVTDPVIGLKRLEQAHTLYPYNYYFCVWSTGEALMHATRMINHQEAVAIVKEAETWCDIGLALNPQERQLNLFKARLLQARDPAAAVTLWEDYVDWRFWDPFVHSVSVDLYATAGMYAEALDSLAWTRGSPYHAQAESALRSAWAGEMASPPDLP